MLSNLLIWGIITQFPLDGVRIKVKEEMEWEQVELKEMKMAIDHFILFSFSF